MNKCSKCGHETESDKFCPNCGTEFPKSQEKNIENFPDEVNSDQNIRNKENAEGKPLESQKESSSNVNSEGNKNKKRTKIIVICAVVVLVLILCAGSLFIMEDNTADNSSSNVSTNSSSSDKSSSGTSSSDKPTSSKPKEKIEPVTFTGSGDDIIDVPSNLSTSLVTAKYEGSHNFVVKALDKSMNSVDLLVNTIGTYDGTTLIGTRSATVSHLEINSSGPWTVTLTPLEDAPSLTNGESYQGDKIFKLSASNANKLTITNNGKSNFVVRGVMGSGDINLLVNEIGNYSGTVVNKNYSLLMVESSGTWSVSW